MSPPRVIKLLQEFYTFSEQFFRRMAKNSNPKCFFDVSIGGEKGRLIIFLMLGGGCKMGFIS